MQNFKKLPISVVWLLLMILTFTFVDYTWIFSAAARMFFALVSLVGAGVLTAMNHDLKFW